MTQTAFEKILIEQAKAHPSMEPQDAMKLCYQAVFGAEHLLIDKDRALQYFMDEYTEITGSNEAPFEPVSSGYCRGNLAAWKELGLPPEWLFRMFYCTASEKSDGTDVCFESYLDVVQALAKIGALPFGLRDWQTFQDLYQTNGKGPLHHSETYKNHEHPTYRIVKSGFSRLLPLLLELAKLPQTKKVRIIAIDGRAAAGKTTIGRLLADVIGAEVIHMDDFFLPPELRTMERFAEAGGNVHFERFFDEVLPKLKRNEPFSYRCFDCDIMTYGEYRKIGRSDWRIVEGAYCCHPAFGEYMDLRVFCDVLPDEQIRRIIARNGLEMANVYFSKWIPMEEYYFASGRIREKASIII